MRGFLILLLALCAISSAPHVHAQSGVTVSLGPRKPSVASSSVLVGTFNLENFKQVGALLPCAPAAASFNSAISVTNSALTINSVRARRLGSQNKFSFSSVLGERRYRFNITL